MSKEQKLVLLGMISAVIISVIYVYCGFQYFGLKTPIIQSQGDRLAYALKWEILAAVMLWLGVATIARQRFFTAQAIDGSKPESGSSLEINIRYLQNTLEQFILLFISHLGLSLTLPPNYLTLIPILVSLFILARIAFWIGYHYNPIYRALGFALTFYPTVIVLVYDIYNLFFV